VLDAWIAALGFIAFMFAAWVIGWRVGRRAPLPPGDDPSVKFADASMAVLGLLPAFTFAMALGRHDSLASRSWPTATPSAISTPVRSC
jgi:hypothetical protein